MSIFKIFYVGLYLVVSYPSLVQAMESWRGQIYQQPPWRKEGFSLQQLREQVELFRKFSVITEEQADKRMVDICWMLFGKYFDELQLERIRQVSLSPEGKKSLYQELLKINGLIADSKLTDEQIRELYSALFFLYIYYGL